MSVSTSRIVGGDFRTGSDNIKVDQNLVICEIIESRQLPSGSGVFLRKPRVDNQPSASAVLHFVNKKRPRARAKV